MREKLIALDGDRPGGPFDSSARRLGLLHEGDQFDVGNVLEIGSDKLGGERRIIHDKSSDRHSRRRSDLRENASPPVRW